METALFIPIISVLFLIVAGALIFLSFTYRQLVEHFERLYKRSAQADDAAFQKANKIVESAQEKSHQILEKSEEKAQEIVISAEFFSAASQQELGEKLKEATQNHLTEYNQMLETFRKDLGTTFDAMSKDLEVGADKELEAFRQSIQKQTQDAQTEFNAQISKNFQVAQDEVTAYKQAMIKKIDEQAFAVVKEVISEVAPKVLTNEDHEQLVIKALTEAKQSHAI